MAKEPPEFEVLLKHVDRAGTRAVDGTEEDETDSQAPVEKKPLKPDVVSPHATAANRPAAPTQDGRIILWGWLGFGILLGIAATLWITTTFY